MKRGYSAARKQLEGPFTAIARAMSKHWKVRIEPSGTELKTDGEVIRFPWNADDIDSIPFQVLNGYLDHEVGHIAEEREHRDAEQVTPLTILNRDAKTKALKLLFNAFEDIRMEIKRSRMYPGVAENLAASQLHSVARLQARDASVPRNFWLEISKLVILEAHGHELAGFHPTHLWAFGHIREEVSQARKARWAKDSFKLACAAHAKLLALVEENAGDDGEDEGEEGGESVPVEIESDQDGDDQGSEPGPAAAGDEEGEEGDEEGGEGGSDDEDEGDEGDESGEPSSGSEDGSDESGEEGDDEGGKPSEGDSDEEGDGDADDGSKSDSFDQSGDPAKGDPAGDAPAGETVHTELPEPSADEIDRLRGELAEQPETDHIMDEIAEEINRESRALARDGYVPDPEVAKLDQWITPSDYSPVRYERVVEEAREQISALKRKLITVLAARSESRRQFDQEQGRLDTSSLHQLRLGSKRVFFESNPGIEIDTSVLILVDLSGSMGSAEEPGSSAHFARMACVALAETFEHLHIPFEVIGYHNTYDGARYAHTGAAARAAGGSELVARLPFEYFVFKAFQERFKKVRTRLVGISGRQENADGEALLASAKRLAARPEQRKLMIVLSDGAPSCPGLTWKKGSGHLVDAIKRITNSGIELFGVGLRHETIKQYYSPENGASAVVVNGYDEMARDIFKAVRAKVLGRAA